jgi:hypothetical protein
MGQSRLKVGKTTDRVLNLPFFQHRLENCTMSLATAKLPMCLGRDGTTSNIITLKVPGKFFTTKFSSTIVKQHLGRPGPVDPVFGE